MSASLTTRASSPAGPLAKAIRSVCPSNDSSCARARREGTRQGRLRQGPPPPPARGGRRTARPRGSAPRRVVRTRCCEVAEDGPCDRHEGPARRRLAEEGRGVREPDPGQPRRSRFPSRASPGRLKSSARRGGRRSVSRLRRSVSRASAPDLVAWPIVLLKRPVEQHGAENRCAERFETASAGSPRPRRDELVRSAGTPRSRSVRMDGHGSVEHGGDDFP
jgi:hypothetical protein